MKTEQTPADDLTLDTPPTRPLTIGDTHYGSKSVAEMERLLALESAQRKCTMSHQEMVQSVQRLKGLFADDEEYDGSLDFHRHIMDLPPLRPDIPSRESWDGTQMGRLYKHVWCGEPRTAALPPPPRTTACNPQSEQWIREKRAQLLEIVTEPAGRFTNAQKLRAIELDAYLDGYQPTKFHPAVLHFQVRVFLEECGFVGEAPPPSR